MSELGLSARAHDKILRVARTISDLEAASSGDGGAAEAADLRPAAPITSMHINEAINYRMLDRNLWK
jgi:magnesium chelatase family protein